MLYNWKSKFLICNIALFLIGCAAIREEPIIEDTDVDYPIRYQGEAKDAVWVIQKFSGGKQCDEINERPPDSVRMLLDYGVAVYDFYSESLPVCLSCGCPDYSVLHHVLISTVDISLADELGFMP
jgi:hypothetical protein